MKNKFLFYYRSYKVKQSIKKAIKVYSKNNRPNDAKIVQLLQKQLIVFITTDWHNGIDAWLGKMTILCLVSEINNLQKQQDDWSND